MAIEAKDMPVAGIIIAFITAILGALGYFAKNWKERIERDIEGRVEEKLCRQFHVITDERRSTDVKRVGDMFTELRLLEARFNEHIAEKGKDQ